MQQLDATTGQILAADAPAAERATFIKKAYMHVAGAILGFAGIEMYIFSQGWHVQMTQVMLAGSWLLVLGAFIVVGMLATHVAMRARSLAAQYSALAGFVVAEAIIFVPMLTLAAMKAPGIIESAAVVTLLGCAGLTLVAFITGKDFSFLRGLVMWGGILALVAIVGAVIFGFELGTWFSVLMIGLAGAAVLWDTSNIMYHYPTDRYVGAALALFASIAMMFWYVLRLFLARE